MIPLIPAIPFNAKIYWLCWILTLTVTIALGYRNRSRNRFTIQEIILIAGFSLAGVFALLDWDGITAITIGCVLGLALALKEVKNSFENKFLRQRIRYQYDRPKIILQKMSKFHNI
jgi:CHASE2 domain-containing sensor protein